MSDNISVLAGQLRPFWLRDDERRAGGSGILSGGGGAMVAHALNGVYHTGTIDEAQAPWAATKDELAAIDTHARLHNVFEPADHIATGAQWQVAGFTATDTWGKLTPSTNPGAAAALLRTDSAGALGLTTLTLTTKLRTPLIDTSAGDLTIQPAGNLALSPTGNQVTVGAAMTLYGDGNVTTGPDIQFLSHGLIAAQNTLYLNIDSNNSGTDAALVVLKDSATNAGTELARLTEAGQLSVLTNVQTPLVNTASGNLTLNSASGLVTIGSAITFSTNGSATVAPDILFATNGLIAAELGMHFAIDTANAPGNSSFTWFSGDDVTGGTGTELMTLAENGYLTVSGRVRTPRVDTAANELTISPATDIILNPGSALTKLASGTSFQSDNYASQLTGMRVTHLGEGDFRYVYTDELHAKSFIADLEQALAGGQIISKSVAVLAQDFTAPAAGAAAFLYVQDLPSAEDMAVFQANDIVRLRTFSRAGGSLSITNCWGVVTGYLDLANKIQRWTFTRSTGGDAGAMVAGTVVKKDALVLDYGQSGNGFYEVNAIDGLYGLNSPYAQVVSWTAHPATGQKVRARLGNLRGISGAADEYGLYAGDGTSNLSAYLRISSDIVRFNNINLQMWDSGGQTFHLAADGSTMWIGPSGGAHQLDYNAGSLTIVGSITANAGYIGGASGWAITTGSLASSNIRLLSGASAEARLEVGTPGLAGVLSRGTGTGTVFWAGATYADLIASAANAPFRVGLDGAMVAKSGSIGGESGAGWMIATGALTSTDIGLYAGTSGRLEVGLGEAAAGITRNTGGGAPMIWAGSSYGNRALTSTPFRVLSNGTLFATSANITGTVTAIAGAIGGWTIASGQLSSTNIKAISGDLNTARFEVGAGTATTTAGVRGGNGTAADIAFWAGGVYTNLLASKFYVKLNGDLYAENADIAGNVIAETGSIANWTISGSTISSTSNGLALTTGALGTARLEVGSSAGIASVTGAGQTVFWAGDSYANRNTALFRVDSSGKLTAADVVLSSSINISGSASVNGSIYAGAAALRLSTDGQRFVLPNVAGSVNLPTAIPTSSSALRWFPAIDGTHDTTKNYAGLIAYRSTTDLTVDLAFTSFVGSTDDNTYYSRVMLQAGHHDGAAYSDARLEVVRPPGTAPTGIVATSDQMTVTADLYVGDDVYVVDNCSAQSFTDRTPFFDGDGLLALRGIKGDGRGNIDHSSLPAFARRQVRRGQDGDTEEGRDIGAMISILVRAIQQLEATAQGGK